LLSPSHGFWQNIESDQPDPQSLEIPGLKSPVEIAFDSLMIPHIFAQNDEDLYYAQGYITAMHRLWQMEFQTHAAAGRISEIIPGEATLDYDRKQRRLGMVYGAENALKSMMANDTAKMMVEQYTAGINAYIESLGDADLPFEYKLLNYKPEPWTPLKCGLLLKSMAQTLNMGDKDIEVTNALKRWGIDVVNQLYPDDEGVGEPIVSRPNDWKFNPVRFDSIPLAVPPQLIPPKVVGVKKRDKIDPTTGSNNWAVSGSKTATGAPILCNDPHLRLTLPSIWYAIHLHSPSVNVMGVSLPGSPAVIIGFNDSIAWGVTNAQRDLVDWFAISFENQKKDSYRVDGAYQPTTKKIEEIKVRGAASFYDTVVYTQYGPITYDEKFHADEDLNGYAFRWVAHDPSEELMTFYRLNRGRNHRDYMKALNHYSSPAQNFVFASVQGDVAMRIQGKFPVRRKNEGRFVLNGEDSRQAWQAFVPNEHQVMEKNPLRGFVSSANQYHADPTYPYYLTATHYEAYRNRRINQVLATSSKITVDDMMKLQNDNYNLKAEESLPYFLAMVDSMQLNADEQEAIDVLRKWDYYNQRESAGAVYYEAWWDNLLPLVWDEMQNDSVDLYTPTTYQTIKLLKTVPAHPFFDVASTPAKETARELIRQSFKLGVQDVVKWKTAHSGTVAWGKYKDAVVSHLLPPMKALSYQVDAGGNHDIVNAHSRTHGPSWRMIVSLEKTGMKAFAVYPGGQSGNPGSMFYGNMIGRWTNGQYYQLQFPKSVSELSFGKITLTPASK